jgi:hypothetical protein
LSPPNANSAGLRVCHAANRKSAASTLSKMTAALAAMKTEDSTIVTPEAPDSHRRG